MLVQGDSLLSYNDSHSGLGSHDAISILYNSNEDRYQITDFSADVNDIAYIMMVKVR